MGFEVRINGISCIVGALALLVLPLKWLFASLIAAAVHEICHMLALLAVGCRVHSLKIGIPGAVIETGELSRGQELFCALAGPLGSLVLFLVNPFFPRVALCALVQGIFNLLPVYPMDGGRMLKTGLSMFLRQKNVNQVCTITEQIIAAGICLFGCWCSLVGKLGAAPIILTWFLTARIFWGKIPCNVDKVAVQ